MEGKERRAVSGRLLAVRMDSLGDVLLTGPAVRAMANRGEVTFLAGPIGAGAAHMLPGVDDVIVFDAPWVAADPSPVRPAAIGALMNDLAKHRFDAAAIFTSAHQSPLPIALLLRLVGVPTIAAVSHDYPGSLLDFRLRGDPDVHEVERSLMVVEALGIKPAAGDDLRLRMTPPPPLPRRIAELLPDEYVVVHPGASAPARTLSAGQWADVVAELVAAGLTPVITGRSTEDPDGVVRRAGNGASVDLMGRTDLPSLAAVIAGARAICVGNTGAAHVAAAVGTRTVVAHAPTVPLERWRPWGVQHRALGDQQIACRRCHTLRCPLPEQSCLSHITGADVLSALAELGVTDREPAS